MDNATFLLFDFKNEKRWERTAKFSRRRSSRGCLIALMRDVFEFNFNNKLK